MRYPTERQLRDDLIRFAHLTWERRLLVALDVAQFQFAFVHPKGLNGVLTEVIDYKWDDNDED